MRRLMRGLRIVWSQRAYIQTCRGSAPATANHLEPRMLSGGPIDLHEGWALLPFQGRKPHYWNEDTATMPATIGPDGRARFYRSACGLLGVTNDKVPALGAGDYPACKRCEKAARKPLNARDRLTFAETL